MRWFDGGSLVLNTAADNKTVAASHFERLVTADHFQMTGHHIDELVVGMAVAHTDPSFFHAMLGQKQLVIMGTDQSRKPRLRCALFGLGGRHYHNIRKIMLHCSFHTYASESFACHDSRHLLSLAGLLHDGDIFLCQLADLRRI